jgi:putative endonuclease
MKRHYYVYILTNPTYTVLYTGFTNDLLSRMHQHRNHLLDGFTNRYNVTRLVYCEESSTVWDAIQREKQIKGGTRARKIELIESINPGWCDLAESWFAPTPAPDSEPALSHAPNGYLRMTVA